MGFGLASAHRRQTRPAQMGPLAARAGRTRIQGISWVRRVSGRRLIPLLPLTVWTLGRTQVLARRSIRKRIWWRQRGEGCAPIALAGRGGERTARLSTGQRGWPINVHGALWRLRPDDGRERLWVVLWARRRWRTTRVQRAGVCVHRVGTRRGMMWGAVVGGFQLSPIHAQLHLGLGFR